MKKILFAICLFVSTIAVGQSPRVEARGLDNKFAPVFNPQDWGATPDSSTDSQPAFQAMVNAIQAGPKRGTVYIPAGVYKFNSTVAVPSNVRINWGGAGSSFDTIITNASAPGSYYGVTKIVVSSATIDAFRDSSMGAVYHDFDIQNTNSSPTAGAAINSFGNMFSAYNMSIKSFYYGIEQQNSTNADISHIGFRDLVKYGLYTFNAWNGDIGDMSVSRCQFSCYFRHTDAMSYNLGSGGLKFTSCKWNGGGALIGDCIRFQVTGASNASTDLVVDASSLENFTSNGVSVLTSGTGGTFGNITITGGNISSYNGGTAISLVNTSPGTLNHISITGVVINNDNVGIVATNVDDLHILGCSNTATTKYNFTNVTNLRTDENSTEVLDGFMSAQNTKYLDSAVAAFYQAGGTSTPAIGSVVVQDDFTGTNTTNFTGRTPSPTSLGNWTNLYSSGFVNLGISSNQLYCPTSGLAGFYVATGLTNYDVSVVVTNATITASGSYTLMGNLTDINNFLFVQINSGGTLDFYQHIGGAYAAIAAGVTATFANGDTLHMRTYGNLAYVLKNSTVITSGTYSPTSLTGTACGIGYSGNTATTLDHFTVTTSLPPAIGGGWAINHDNTLTGSGTPLDPLKAVGGGGGTDTIVVGNAGSSGISLAYANNGALRFSKIKNGTGITWATDGTDTSATGTVTLTWQQALTNGSTLTTANTIANGTNVTNWSGTGIEVHGSTGDNSTGRVQIRASSNYQLGLEYDATHTVSLKTGSTGDFGVNFSTSGAALIPGANLTYNLGNSSSQWQYLNVGAVIGGFVNEPDGNQTASATVTTMRLFTSITANRTITISTRQAGTYLTIINPNTSGFAYTYASTVKDLTGTTITAMANGTTDILYYDGTTLYKVK